jgi:hypothetical protein
MRIVIGGETSWRCDDLASAIVRRLIARYGPDLVIAHRGRPGVDQSFSLVCHAMGTKIDFRPVEFGRVGDFAYEHREMLRRGADLCLIIHRSAFDQRRNDLMRQAIEAGVPTYWITDERGAPRRLGPPSGHAGPSGRNP